MPPVSFLKLLDPQMYRILRDSNTHFFLINVALQFVCTLQSGSKAKIGIVIIFFNFASVKLPARYIRGRCRNVQIRYYKM